MYNKVLFEVDRMKYGIVVLCIVLLLSGCREDPGSGGSVSTADTAATTVTTEPIAEMTATTTAIAATTTGAPAAEGDLALLRQAREAAEAVTGCRYNMECDIRLSVMIVGEMTLSVKTKGTFYYEDGVCKTRTLTRSEMPGQSKRTETYLAAENGQVRKVQNEGSGWWGGISSLTPEQVRQNSNPAFLLLASVGEPLSVRVLGEKTADGQTLRRLAVTFPNTAWESLLTAADLSALGQNRDRITASLRLLGPATAEFVIDTATGVITAMRADLAEPLQRLVADTEMPFGLDNAANLNRAVLMVAVSDYNAVEDFPIPEISPP
ncbi:MAG: hypothetical protein FWE80_01620 [Oscillospiraceae bacterium]|nr:hypothetical protein [Oscillospiraceae bacterium]